MGEDRSDQPDLAGAVNDPSSELSRLLKAWRLRLDPNSIAGLVRGPRAQKHLTHADIAQLTGMSAVWYGKLERGGSANYGNDLLDRVAYALRLNPQERRTLYLLAVGHEPATVLEGASSFLPSDALRRLIHAQPWPCYISDQAWQVVDYNEHMLKWFPWMGEGFEDNIMRWVFLDPAAKVQLHRWDTDWAPLMLAQMFHANAQRRDNMALANLIREILERSKEARQMWDRQPQVYVHPDGDQRYIYIPYRKGIQRIELVALEPMRAAGVRVMNLVPIGELTPVPQEVRLASASSSPTRSKRVARSSGSA